MFLRDTLVDFVVSMSRIRNLLPGLAKQVDRLERHAKATSEWLDEHEDRLEALERALREAKQEVSANE